MSLSLSPKALFQQQEDARTAFRGMARSEAFQQALVAALAEYGNQRKTTTEQLSGVREFVSILLNVAEPNTPAKRLPAKSLQYEVPEPAK